jgi:hypothetical protein
MAVAFMIIVSMQLGGASADSTVENLSKATMSVDTHVLAAGEALTIAMSSSDTATIDLSYTKNITGLKIQDAKEYFVVQNHDGTTAILTGQTVMALDLMEAKVVEQAF